MRGKDIISMLDVTRDELEHIFNVAHEMEKYAKSGINLLKNKIADLLFFEPSTRTRLSFETAMLRLGGSVSGFSNISSTSVAKGETLADTIKMADAYSDIIVIRHRCEGAAKFAAEIAEVPVINGGDGSQHHPTQAILDMYTMWKEFGRIDGLHVAMVADLKHARLMASLSQALSYYDTTLSLVAPRSLMMRQENLDYLKGKNIKVQKVDNLKDIIHDVDVIEVTRIMPERFLDPIEYEKIKGSYIIDRKAIKGAKDSMIILHGLPRVDEMPPEVDKTRHARYFQQAANGIPVRMALLSLVFGAGR